MTRYLIVLLVATVCQAADKVTLSNGVQVTIDTSLGHPTGTTTITTSMVRATGDSFYRIFRDQNNLSVFAYELRLGRSADHNFEVTARPATADFASRFPNSDAGKPTPTFSSPQSFNLDSGQDAAIPVFNLEGQGLDVIDTVSFNFEPKADDNSGASLQFSNLRININGKPVVSSPNRTVTGRYAMFYLPSRGGYFFSTAPAPGFAKVGSIQGVKMQFAIDNEIYEATSQFPISQQGELWVQHDPAYRPMGSWTSEQPDQKGPAEGNFFSAASDTLDWWLKEDSSKDTKR